MTRRLLAVLLILSLCVAMLPAQELLPRPAEGIETILELLDVVNEVEAEILGGRPVSATGIGELRDLAEAADTLGAEDLGARVRALVVIARGFDPPPELPPDLLAPVGPPPPPRVYRGENASFRTWSRVLAAGGAASIILSGVFAATTERDFQRWRVETDPVVGAELYTAWRTYELLSLSFGGVALLGVGAGVPLLFAFTVPATGGQAAPRIPTYTPSERDARLTELYARRAGVVASINALSEGSPRELIQTVGWVAGGLGAVTAIAAFVVSEQRYQRYIEAPFSDEAESYRKQVVILDITGIATASVSTLGFATAITTRVLTPSRTDLVRELRAINEQIVRLRTW